MAGGMYICHERVERDGYLVAFAGEKMTMDEAARRGLVSDGPAETAGPAKAQAKRRADWVAEAEALGVEVPPRATIAQIRALIEDARE